MTSHLSTVRSVICMIDMLLSSRIWLKQSLQRDEEFQGLFQGDGCQTPDSMLPVAEHRECVSVPVPGAEMCVTTVLRVAQVR